MEANYIYKEMN